MAHSHTWQISLPVMFKICVSMGFSWDDFQYLGEPEPINNRSPVHSCPITNIMIVLIELQGTWKQAGHQWYYYLKVNVFISCIEDVWFGKYMYLF